MPQQLKTCRRKTTDDEFYTMYKDCVREFIKHLVNCKIDFILIVSDVLRYSIKKGKTDFGVDIWKGWDAQKFYRPDGTIQPVHCGWIASFQDTWGENKRIKE